MENVNKIIESLSPSEQNVMHYKRNLIEVQSTLLTMTKEDIMLSAIFLV